MRWRRALARRAWRASRRRMSTWSRAMTNWMDWCCSIWPPRWSVPFLTLSTVWLRPPAPDRTGALGWGWPYLIFRAHRLTTAPEARADAAPWLVDDPQDHLAVLAPGGAAQERRAGLGEGEGRIDLGPQLAGVDQPGRLQQLLAVGLADDVAGAGRLRRARHAPAGQAGRAGQHLTARGVEQQVAWLARLHQQRAPAAGQLHGHMPDPAARPRDGDALPRLQPPMDDQRLPGAQPGHRDRRRLEVAQRTR